MVPFFHHLWLLYKLYHIGHFIAEQERQMPSLVIWHPRWPAWLFTNIFQKTFMGNFFLYNITRILMVFCHAFTLACIWYALKVWKLTTAGFSVALVIWCTRNLTGSVVPEDRCACSEWMHVYMYLSFICCWEYFVYHISNVVCNVLVVSCWKWHFTF